MLRISVNPQTRSYRMKTTGVFLLAALLCSSCGTTGGGIDRDVAIQFLKEERLTNDLTTFMYRYSVDKAEPLEITLWVKDVVNELHIMVGSSQQNLTNHFIYNPTVPATNFWYPRLNLREFVYSLREAADRALLLYLANN